MNPNAHDLIVLGAGAAGLSCAAAAAQAGGRVLVLEHMDAPARKLLVTGGGKCNFTNRNVSPGDYWGAPPAFTRFALAGLPPEELLARVARAGIAVEERDHGQMFCRRSAGDMAEFLLDRAAGCDLKTGRRVDRVDRGETQEERFRVRAGNEIFCAPRLVVATGNLAWPQVGATDVGLRIAREFGHRIVPPRPALAGFVLPPGPLRNLAGISVPASVRVLPADGRSLPREDGLAARNLSLLFTHKGISGPAALQASLYWTSGSRLVLDFLPDADLRELLETPGQGKLSAGRLLRRLLPARLADSLVPAALADRRAAELSRADRVRLCDAVHRHSLIPLRTEGFHKAEVAAGGVDTEHISPRTLESKLVPGLFFCGEVLDVTGRLGGYNLHWAFASGALAGTRAVRNR